MKNSDEMFESVLRKVKVRKEQKKARVAAFKSAAIAIACVVLAFVIGAGLEKRVRLPFGTGEVSVTVMAESPVSPTHGEDRTEYVSVENQGGAPSAVAAIPPTVMGSRNARPTPTPIPQSPSPAGSEG
ncbi:MAG: hypothetical protein J5645_09110 [Lachnospiraceae bacterium]|nr:hypothetical protein [Lachnospiraceae bacterium]